MRYLFKVFNESSSQNHNQTYQKRMESETVEMFPISIKPLHYPSEYQMYYVPTANLIKLSTEIYKLNQEVMELFNEIPGIAKSSYIFECLVEEMQNTNEIEGVRSTREEIARSVREINKGSRKKVRFSSMVKSYNKLLSDDLDVLESPEDIRKIYDYLVNEEITKEDKPDGTIFRKGRTYVLKKSGTGKEIHRGITPETQIIHHVTEMIKLLKDEQYPELIKIAVAHYYFGYIHPFYDGNGRTSRFISSIYLNNSLSKLAAISLSRGCNTYNKKYLEAFENTNKVGNRGEMNCFIESFLEIILSSLQEMIAEIKEKRELLFSFKEKIENDSRLEEKTDLKKVIYILAQNFYFSQEKGMVVKDLVKVLNKSEKTIRNLLKQLEDLDIIESIGSRPKMYLVSDSYFE